MAITRAQQVKQMLKEGGRTGFFLGGGGGADYDIGGGGNPNRTSTTSSTNRDDSPPRSRIQEDRQKDFEQQQLKKRMQNLTDDQDFEEAVRSGKIDEKLYSYSVPKSNFPGPVGAGLNLFQGARQRNYEANRDFFLNKVLTSANRGNFKPTFDSYSSYMQQRLAGQIDAYGNPLGGQDDDDDQPIIPLLQDPMTTDQATEELIEEEEEPIDLRARAFKADGGIMGGLADGQMDEMGRQMYGLGKLVKKATRAVKKIAKSPIGKAALIGAASFGIPGTSFGGLFGRASFGTPAKGLFGKFGIGPTLFANPTIAQMKTQGLEKGFFPQLLDKIPGGGVTTAITALSALSALTPAQEKQAQLLADETGIDINDARNQILQAAAGQQDDRARAFKAGGGIMRLGYQEGGDAEPVAKKTMPLLDMGGKEKDYRETGGFVDMGRMERADDVPARLSKNEFVFTADAVRNAGDGDIDKGAEVMYNMMKNLEAGGDVSEESQGLEGARKMFQTSQRLEEVL